MLLSQLKEKAEKAEFVLATDLDGTFLGGSEEDRDALYHFVRTNKDKMLLIFLTGRSVDATLPVLGDQLIPSPDILVADVGATVVDGRSLEKLHQLQTIILESWRGEQAIIERLDGFEQIERQPVPQSNRVSYYVNESEISEELSDAIAELGCNAVFSDGKYLDLLPSGVSKGSTLELIAKTLAIQPGRILAAGDTLNDYSLLSCSTKAVIVANAKDDLRERIKESERVFHSRKNGAGGILEALGHFKLAHLPESKPTAKRYGSADLLVVCHRLPFKETEVDGKVVRNLGSPNGMIATLLRFFENGSKGSWVATSAESSRSPESYEYNVPIDEERLPNVLAARVPFTERDLNLFHKRFAKEALWPVIFSFPGKAQFNEKLWNHYVEINRIIAGRVAREAAKGAFVWFHDYPLWMTPYFLRELRPDLKMSFFHHTAFPAADIFNMLPWSRKIVTSLLQCDHIGFHIPRYVENFLDAVKSHVPAREIERVPSAPRYLTFGCSLGVESHATAIEVHNRVIKLGTHPVGIDSKQISAALAKGSVQKKIMELEKEHEGARCILSLERLDYVKGPIEKLAAFEVLLEEHPEFVGEITLINICTPPPPGQTMLHATRSKVDQLVGRINGRFAKVGWTPIHYYYRSLTFEEVVAHYAVSDISWVTPLRDGLNLVAKEYVAVQRELGRSGALVISEFAGASVELQGAILTNPYESRDMARRLCQALKLPDGEREQRMRMLGDIVTQYDMDRWISDYMLNVEREVKAEPSSNPLFSPERWSDNIAARTT
ncbi:MAG: glucosylglycerol-phosphate synthase [Bdellovibrionales bacterium]|nr:glucosylglycerol-phosphate synthase [Bdellovibrionales bacterium]